jgi:hypothetical protein
MSTSSAELSSLATALSELTRRLTSIADGYASERREGVASELYAVERALNTAVRRLSKVVEAER